MGGNPYNFGSMMLPQAGTPLQSTMNIMGAAGAIPGATGFNTGSTAAYQQQLQGMAQNAAGMTGFYNAPRTSQYSPGTFVRIDPSTYDYATHGDQLDYVAPSGQLQRVTTTQAKQMGWNGSTTDLTTIPFSQAATLESAPPQYLPQQTLQGLQSYQQLNTNAQTAALQAAQATGMYSAPSQIYAPGTDTGRRQVPGPASRHAAGVLLQQRWRLDRGHEQVGGRLQQGRSPVSTRNTTCRCPTSKAPRLKPSRRSSSTSTRRSNWRRCTASTTRPVPPGQAGQAGVNGPQAGQQTQAAQQQQWQQGFSQEQLNQQATQSYLQLLSSLQGPADYGKYLNVLGSTPGGLQGMVSAAAGNYIPGTGSTGQSPQGQTLQNLVGAASGQGGGGIGANAQQFQTGQWTGQQAQPGQAGQQNMDWTAQPGQGQRQAGLPNGGNAPGGGLQAQNWTLGSGQGGSASPGGMNYQNYMAAAQGLPAPNQIAPQAFGNMTPSQQQMMGGMYQQLGYYGPDINAMYQQSLPKYAAGSAAGGMKLV